jgi:hypothetical protein
MNMTYREPDEKNEGSEKDIPERLKKNGEGAKRCH